MQAGKFVFLIPASQDYGTLMLRNNSRGDAPDSSFTCVHANRLSFEAERGYPTMAVHVRADGSPEGL
jgi:hypothetical protein